MAVTPDRPRVVRVTVPGIQGPQGPTGPAGSLELSGQINNSSDITYIFSCLITQGQSK